MIGEFESLIQSLFICQHNTPAFRWLYITDHTEPYHNEPNQAVPALHFLIAPHHSKSCRACPTFPHRSASLQIPPHQNFPCLRFITPPDQPIDAFHACRAKLFITQSQINQNQDPQNFYCQVVLLQSQLVRQHEQLD